MTETWTEQEAAEERARGERANGAGPDGEFLETLAALPRIDYDRRRQAAAEQLGIRVSTLDAEVERRRPPDADETTGADAGLLASWAVEPWADPVSTADLLNELMTVVRRYVVLPIHGAEVLALWILHAWTHDASTVSPILVLASPEKRCGKTTVLTLLRYLSPRPLPAANVTAATVFRAIEKWQPTLLIDEGDSFLGTMRISEALLTQTTSGAWRKSSGASATTMSLRRSPRGPRRRSP